MRLVSDMLQAASLPAGWTRSFDAKAKAWRFTHTADQRSLPRHPLDGYYTGAVFMACGGYARLKEIERVSPCAGESGRKMDKT